MSLLRLPVRPLKSCILPTISTPVSSYKFQTHSFVFNSYSTKAKNNQQKTSRMATQSEPINLTPTEERASELSENYNAVLNSIHSELSSASRDPSEVLLVAVSKYKPESDLMALYNSGVRHFGENYVQELQRKAEVMPKDIKWHFIGALQTNKCKLLCRIKNLYSIETVDTVGKCEKLNSSRDQATDEYPPLKIYLQINTSNEDQKAGLGSLEEAYEISKYIIEKCPNLHLNGLMTIGSFETSVGEGENKDFKKLKQFADEIGQKLKEEKVGLDQQKSWGVKDPKTGGNKLGMSMGMSSDYLEAIRQGSDSVRVGSSIFGARPKKD